MTAGEWANLQYALLDVFGPVIHWWIVLLEAVGALSAVMIVWLALLRWLARLDMPIMPDSPGVAYMRRLIGRE